jgi:hypothetical protein
MHRELNRTISLAAFLVVYNKEILGYQQVHRDSAVLGGMEYQEDTEDQEVLEDMEVEGQLVPGFSVVQEVKGAFSKPLLQVRQLPIYKLQISF